MKIEHLKPDPDNPKRWRTVVEELSIYEIERAEYKKDSQDNWVVIPPEEVRAPGSYVLLIKDKNRKVLGYQ